MEHNTGTRNGGSLNGSGFQSVVGSVASGVAWPGVGTLHNRVIVGVLACSQTHRGSLGLSVATGVPCRECSVIARRPGWPLSYAARA